MNIVWARTDEEVAALRGDELRSSGLFDRLMAEGVLCRCEDLNEVECDACGDAHLEGVTWVTEPHGTGARAYIWCPTTGRVRVERKRLEVWRVDFDGLARVISSLLGLAIPRVIVDGRLWLLGSCQFNDRARNVFIARGATWQDGRSLADHARLIVSTCPVILVPNLLPDESAWRIGARIVLSMSDFDWFGADSGGVLQRITATVAGHERRSGLGNDSTFRKEGATWALSFLGRTIHSRDSLGLGYIAELLRKPHVTIEAAYLAGASVESSSLPALSGIQLADESTIDAVRRRLAEEKTELAGLKESDWTRRGALGEEIAQLEKYLGQVQTHKGHARKVKGTAQRSRTSVTNAIRRAIDQISRQHPDLGGHLKESIKTGTTPVYAPTELPEWDF